jgi:hypothetical protein
MVEAALNALSALQSTGESDIPAGNFPSCRYHPLFRFKRTEDNVYFVSWILQSLKRSSPLFSIPEKDVAQSIITKAEASLIHYRSRYGGAAYNFYRADEWFPNGVFLKYFKTFQPTDDADDSAIAYRGLANAKEFIPELKSHLEEQANGRNGKFLKRGPVSYRTKALYNTWIGSKGLFVDLDLVVVCNILMFNACYELEKTALDRSNIQFVLDVVKCKSHLNEKWSLCAWYPNDVVILYNIADLLITSFYPELEQIREQIVEDLTHLLGTKQDAVSRALTESALMKCGQNPSGSLEVVSLESYLNENQQFSFGVIPLLHPFDGRWAQRISSLSLFRMHYRCDAQALCILIEHELLSRS